MKRTKIIVMLSLWIGALSAQTQYGNEWTIYGGGGSSGLKYEAENVKTGIGGLFGVGYTYYFSRTVGLSLGLEAAMYNSTLTISSLSHEYTVEPPSGLQGSFLLRTNFSGIEERQQAIVAQVPVMLRVQAPVGGSAFFYFGSGGKVGVPVSVGYDQTVSQLVVSGYSAFTGQTFADMPTHGYGAYPAARTKGKASLSSPMMVSGELGFKIGVADKTSLLIGVYVDYGLNDIRKDLSQSAPQFDATTTQYSLSNIINSGYITSKIAPQAFGIKIGIAFGSGKTIEPGTKTPKTKPTKPTKPEPLWGL
ncbi:MAG: porin family protein [Tannerella sp.]|jgi:hypothetical protein|nr:porin family protein [Tannerella sp.]